MKPNTLLMRCFIALNIFLNFVLAQAQDATSDCLIRASLKKVGIPPVGAPDHLLYSYHELQYLSCDFKSTYPTDKDASTVFKQGPNHLETAPKAWVYALMASNTYRKPGRVFTIPGWEATARWASKSGLVLEEWTHKGSGGATDEIVVAFQGTNFESLADWATNLSLIQPKQYREAYSYMQCLKKRSNGVRIVTTGHSLGGALALNMSLRFPGVDYRGFDSSPRGFFSAPGHKKYPVADRIFIYERGEVLSALRLFWYNKLHRFPERYWYNFMNFNGIGATVSEHDMYLIARGLLMVAVKNRDAGARQTFTANLSYKNLEVAFKGDDTPAETKHDIEACKCIFENCPELYDGL